MVESAAQCGPFLRVHLKTAGWDWFLICDDFLENCWLTKKNSF
jgi:hypothetical protein